MATRVTFLAIALLSLAFVRPAAAQDSDLSTRAGEAVEAGLLAQARDLYQQALDQDPSPPTAFNLAGVHEAMGEIRRAHALTEGVLAGEYGELGGSRRTAVEAFRDELREQLGVLEIRTTAAELQVRVDGDEEHSIAPGTPFTVLQNPGSHSVEATTRGGQRDQRTVQIRANATQSVEFDLVDVSLQEDPTVLESPWFWVATVSVVAGAAVVVGLMLGGSPEPTCDPVWGCAPTR